MGGETPLGARTLKTSKALANTPGPGDPPAHPEVTPRKGPLGSEKTPVTGGAIRGETPALHPIPNRGEIRMASGAPLSRLGLGGREGRNFWAPNRGKKPFFPAPN